MSDMPSHTAVLADALELPYDADIVSAEVIGDTDPGIYIENCSLVCDGQCVSDASWYWAYCQDPNHFEVQCFFYSNRYNLSMELYAGKTCCPIVDYEFTKPICAIYKQDRRCRFSFVNKEEFACLTAGLSDWEYLHENVCRCECPDPATVGSCCDYLVMEYNDCPFTW